MRSSTTNHDLVQGFTRHPKRYATALLAAGILFAACGSDSSQTDADASAAADTVAATVVVDNTEAGIKIDTEVDAAEATSDQPPRPEGGPPPDGSGPPPDGASDDAGDDDTLLTTGPQNVGEHGPFSNADFDSDGSVTRAELEEFMDGALERQIGLVAFFDLSDSDGDDILDSDELATVDPAYAFDGTDANEDGLVSLIEVTDYANEDGRSYRAIGLGEFFDLVDTDDDGVVSAEEIEVAHESGLLARF